MKGLFVIYLMFFAGLSAIGQTLYGVVQQDRKGTPFANVTIIVKDKFSKPVYSGITDQSGHFRTGLVSAGKLSMEFSYIGYKTVVKSMELTKDTAAVHIGTVILEPEPGILKEVNISGETPAISLKADKKIFLVGKDILSQAGSVNELLNGVPSVSVNASGGISLRGNNNVLILINGRRSGLTEKNALEQVPADQIEKVEVITNPSSRYEAAGSAGVINLVLKKDRKPGFNGQIKIVGGIPNDTRLVPSINYKTAQLNLFATLGIRLSDYNGLYTTGQSVQAGNISTLLDQREEEKRHDNGKLIYVGGDYQIDIHNSITAAFMRNTTSDHDRTVLDYRYSNIEGKLDSNLIRKGESWEKRDYNQLEFNYTRTFEKQKKRYTIDMQYDFWNSDKNWDLNTTKLNPVTYNLPGIRTNAPGSSRDLCIQTDFVQPWGSNTLIEMGLKGENRSVTTAFKAEQQQKGNWDSLNDMDNALRYNELIGAAYVQFASKSGKFSYQIGIRNELTGIQIRDEAGYDKQKYYNRLFPSVSLSYPVNAGLTVQGSYSRRINRPSLYLLNPFNELTDYNAVFTGNPDLNPSYSNVFQLDFLHHTNTFTVNPAIYSQSSRGSIQNYTYRDTNGTFITLPVNIEKDLHLGIEVSVVYKPEKWWQTNLEVNFYHFQQSGWYEQQNFEYVGNTFTGRFNTQFKLPGKSSLQCRYNFTGAKSNAQGRTAPVHHIDFGLGKTLFNDKANLLFDIANLFNLRKFQTSVTGSDYTFIKINNPNAERYRLTFIYKLSLKDNIQFREAKKGNRD